MKKIYSLIAVAALATTMSAQNRVSSPLNVNLIMSTPTVLTEMAPTDTLWRSLATWTAPALNGSAGGGYVTGNNGYQDKQKALEFTNSTGTVIYGMIMWFGAKEVTSGNPNSVVKMRIYAMDGTGTTSSGTGAAPNTVIQSNDVAITMVDTSLNLSLAYIHTFTTPSFVNSDFAVGFDVTGLAAGDTIGMVNSANGEAFAQDQSWDQWSDNAWHSYFEPNNWNLNVDQAMFPIVDMQSSVEEMSFINGVKLTTYPNPTVENATVTYELETDINKVEIKILDATGKVVKVINQGSQCAGVHTLSIDANDLAAGTYYVTLKAGKGQMATPLVIQ